MMNNQLLSKLKSQLGTGHTWWVAIIIGTVFTLALPAGLLQAAPGVDGNLTINAADVVLNRYSAVTGIAGNVVTVNDITELADGGAGHYASDPLAAGDMILIYQAQGATFTDNSNTVGYGAFAYNNAGRYEFALVSSVAGNDITVDSGNSAPYSCGGITNSYDIPAGNVQVVRVPQYAGLTVNASGSIIAPDWDGAVGGVVALLAQGGVVVNGQIDATGSGFRGGRLDIDGHPATIYITSYRESNGFTGAVKGESVLGEDAAYYLNGGPYGRGAPANGGGGGNNHNSGGGGGANGSNGGAWTGGGVPDTSDSSWDNAWDLDDGTDDGGTPLPVYLIGGAGGGRGGYSYAAFNGDATVAPPGNSSWGGNLRLQVGGLGGRPLMNDPANQLFFGGGGGAGDDNNFTGTRGGHGGGLVIIAAGSLSGSGQILSNGDDAEDIALDYEDGAGGGGAGGSIVIKATNVAGITVNANGGSGGNGGILGQPTIHMDESFGSGGGGGGGYVAVDSGSGFLTTAVLGGSNGYSASEALSEFPPNGATGGYEGGSSTADFSFPGCLSPTAISLSSATISAHLSWWPLLVFLLLLGMSGFLLKGRLIRSR